MIPRFSRPDMAAIWTQENKYRTWLEVELVACEAQESLGVIPAGVTEKIRAKAGFNAERIDAIEREVKHDVIAFLTNVGEYVGEDARHIHLGMTSSDVLDTAFALQLRQASDMILAGLDRVLAALRRRALEHKNTLCVGRSHGIHGEPTTFGLKLAGHYTAFLRARRRMELARDEISTVAISGAVGTFATIDPRVQAFVAKKLGMREEPVSTQVIPRDRHAMFFSVLGVIASSIENLATEIRHLQRTEVREAEEFFSAGQKGSSAMPHKRNPVLTENLTGLARLIRASVTPALENVALWHERDISHSAVERVIAPDATIVADFALNRLAGVIENLLVYPERMKRNMESLKGLVFSQAALLALVDGGMSREDAYKTVQAQAMAVWDNLDGPDFKTRLAGDAAVIKTLGAEGLDKVFDYSRYTKHVAGVIDAAVGEGQRAAA
ncbi:MAG TPA: adenylosuccinate lyase [Alphaproteobacteria bacterium]|nr:adenylosuccinate lyase [Rhodospirillaceae bacterium]HRJ65530.1 adenylosuccinate lyase [Alphaproteobacteria bacterium]